ncbi:MAG TPA: hypothetical protein VHP58_02970 [Alphaproteobacteria bacterium]|nr:hypothetical protein [Alphaproteobacteria bacterium]
MAIIVCSYREIHVWPKNAPSYTALFVPSQDQQITLRDLTASTSEIATRVRAEGRIPLWRERRNLIIVYGFLNAQLKEIRQSLRIWLAEDFAPAGCPAFFYVFGNTVVHGIKEIDDERRETWQSTVLTFTAETLADGLTAAAADLLLRFQSKDICVAVDGDFEKAELIKTAMKPLEINVIPYAKLAPARNVEPLYAHRDFTIPMVLSLLVLALLVLGSLGFAALNMVNARRLTDKLQDIRHQIESIQINQNLGYIHEPKPVLDTMKKAFEQQPSAILDAAGAFGHALGEIKQVEFSMDDSGAADMVATTGILPITVKYTKTYDKLLVKQESTTKDLLPKAPWIRTAASVPDYTGLKLVLKMQIQSPPGVKIPSATQVFQPVLPPPAEDETAPPAGETQ